jgi:D-amino-acid dehydrogenase
LLDVLVLGAGIVGVSTGLAARRRGLSVAVLDRKAPGREPSYGNSGVLSSGSIFPLNGPSLWASLPSYLTNRHPALRYSLPHVMANWTWSARFLMHARPPSPDPRRAALHGLIQPSLRLHRQWIAEAGLSHRLRETGWLKVWRSEAHETAKADRDALAQFGIRSELMDRQAISGLEPSLSPIYPVGLLHKDTASVDSPGAIVEGYARLFVDAGGEIRQGEVTGLQRDGDAWIVRTAGAEHRARNVVNALGPWAGDLMAPLGYRVPLRWERGYHREFATDPAIRLSRPVHDTEGGFVIVPVEKGTRITSGVELAHRDAPSNFRQIEQATERARAVLPFGEPVGEVWRGARPTLPDSLPMIGEAPHHRGLWCAFGHQHVGLSTGTGTGDAIAALIAGEEPPFDVAPFAPGRFL